MYNQRYQNFLEALEYCSKKEGFNYNISRKNKNVAIIKKFGKTLCIVLLGYGIRWCVFESTTYKNIDAKTASDLAEAIKIAYKGLLNEISNRIM